MMWKSMMGILGAAALGHAADQAAMGSNAMQSTPPLEGVEQFPTQSYMMLLPAARAADFQQAFETLRKEKTAAKVYFQLFDGSMITNIIDMTLMSNSTMILFRYNSPQGIGFQLVKVEEIQTIGY